MSVLVFRLTTATGGAHYFFFFALQDLQVPQVQALPLGLPLPKPGSPFFLPQPHLTHIIFYLS
jgi:hypothetical protein